MIAQLSPAKALTGDYQQFLEALKASGFRGEISADYASRVVLATDNSIYQRLPQAAVFPLDAEDVARVEESHTGRYLAPMLDAARQRAAE